MAVADTIRAALGSQSLIRKMFDEGIVLKKQYGPENVFDFSLGNPDIDPPSAFFDTLEKLLKEKKKGAHGYMPNGGFPDVKEALSKKVSSEQNVNIDGTHIIMSCGAAGGINVIFKSVINPGDEVIIVRPYFTEYHHYISNHNGITVEADSLLDFNLDIDSIKSKLTPKTAVVLINSPHNPTGRIYPKETISALASALNEHGKKCGRFPYLVSDEPYREIVYDGLTAPPILSAYSESLVVYSYSKSLSLPGERIGYIAIGPENSDKQNLIASFTWATRILGFLNAPALMQRTVAELCSATVDVEVYARRRSAFTKIFDEVGIEYAKPEGTFYLFCKVPKGKQASDDLAFIDHLKQHLVLCVPGKAFGAPGWFRVAYCIEEKIITASAEAFKKAMSSW